MQKFIASICLFIVIFYSFRNICIRFDRKISHTINQLATNMRAKVKKTTDITKKYHLLAIQLLSMKFPPFSSPKCRREKSKPKNTNKTNT